MGGFFFWWMDLALGVLRGKHFVIRPGMTLKIATFGWIFLVGGWMAG